MPPRVSKKRNVDPAPDVTDQPTPPDQDQTDAAPAETAAAASDQPETAGEVAATETDASADDTDQPGFDLGDTKLADLAAEFGMTPEEFVVEANRKLAAQGRDVSPLEPEWMGEPAGDEDLDAREHGSVHTTHDAQTMEYTMINDAWDEPWKAPMTLDAPPPLPGMEQRWIAVSLRGQDQPANVSRKFREGWVPRPADTIPAEFGNAPTIKHGQFEGFIGVEGMVLCHMPKDRVDQRNRHYRQKAARQIEGVERELHGSEVRGMPIHQSMKSTFTRRSPVEPAPDAE